MGNRRKLSNILTHSVFSRLPRKTTAESHHAEPFPSGWY